MEATPPPFFADGVAARVDDSHRLQAAALWHRWRSRIVGLARPAAAARVPDEVPFPLELWHHYRRFAWVFYEQRLMFVVLGFLLVASAMVGGTAWHLRGKPPIVLRAAPSLKEAAAAFYGAPDLSYDQLAFFLHGCLPLLYAEGQAGHPFLPLAEGLVDPEIYRAAERRLTASRTEVTAHGMTQTLSLTSVAQVALDALSGRAAADVGGYLTVTVKNAEARFFPWRGRVVVAVNPGSRLNPYAFYLLRLDERTGPEIPGPEREVNQPAAVNP